MLTQGVQRHAYRFTKQDSALHSGTRPLCILRFRQLESFVCGTPCRGTYQVLSVRRFACFPTSSAGVSGYSRKTVPSSRTNQRDGDWEVDETKMNITADTNALIRAVMQGDPHEARQAEVKALHKADLICKTSLPSLRVCMGASSRLQEIGLGFPMQFIAL